MRLEKICKSFRNHHTICRCDFKDFFFSSNFAAILSLFSRFSFALFQLYLVIFKLRMQIADMFNRTNNFIN